jgi:hypothetical protein
LGSKEEPVEVILIGRVTLQDLLKALQESYQRAGPRFGIIPVPPWRVREREKKKSKKKIFNEDKGSNDSAKQGGRVKHRVILHRPVTLRSENPSQNCVVDLETAVLVIKGPGITLQGVDICGYGRPGLAYCETHGLVRQQSYSCTCLRQRYKLEEKKYSWSSECLHFSLQHNA